jgi:non-canonical (house-cleaning) NTP pyrophosphatase
MTITICGSVSFFDAMEEIRTRLEHKGYVVYAPIKIPGFDYATQGESVETAQAKIAHDLINSHYRKIENSDAILVVNLEKKGVSGYVGGNTLLEMGFAYVLNRKIFVYADLAHMPYYSEMMGMEPVVINEDLDQIDRYFVSLERVYVASDNTLKKRAVSSGALRVKHPVSLFGIACESGVAAQPVGWMETLLGCETRLGHLRRSASAYSYLVSFESGMVDIFGERKLYDIHICIVERADGVRKTALSSSVAFPAEMTDKIPRIYPDLGVLVQQEYTSVEKDPIVYLTHNALSREDLLRQAFIAAFSQF